MTLTVPLEAAPASPIVGVPSVALLILAVIALAFASVAQSVEQAIQRLTLAGVEDLIEEEHRNARTLYGLVDHRRRTLLSLRAFRTFWQVVYAVTGTIVLVDTRLPWWAIALIAVSVIAVIQLIFVSFLPAQWGARNPEGIALVGTGLADRLARLSHVADPLLTRVRSSRPAPEPTEAQARAELISDLREIVDEVGEPESFEEEDRDMVRSVLDLGHTLVREVMVPRTDMVTIDADTPAPSALRLFVRSGFSRIPVVGDDVDDIRGILFFKDLVSRWEATGGHLDLRAEQMMRPAEYAVEMKPADDMLRQMQAERFHMAIVIDEYGGVAGLVTLEDILEEVVGDDVDDIRGILYFKDLVSRWEATGGQLDMRAEQMMRPAEFAVEMKPADDMLRQMQAKRFHMAIVIDEYGGVAGLVTLEDLLEEVVGELTDEHDRHSVEPEEVEPGVWRVPARYPISELGELLDREIEDEDIDSVGGLLAKAIGRVPLPGATGTLAGVIMTAEEARGRRRQVSTILCRLDPDAQLLTSDLNPADDKDN